VKKLKGLLIITILTSPLLLIAQEVSRATATSVIHQNTGFASMLAQLLPMGINPYATIFMTTVFSKFGLENDYVATNPFFDSWFVLILFGGLFLFTSLVGIGLADNYLSGHAAVIINVFVILAPTFFASAPEGEVMQQAGFLDVGLKTLVILIMSIYFLVIVSSVRFFIDILIFLSPIPLIDSILEISKIVVAILFVFLAAVFPKFSAFVSIAIFICCLFMYKKSKQLINNTKYLFIYPVLGFFRKEPEISNEDFSIPVYIKLKTKKLKKGTIAKLIKREGKTFLIKERFFVSDIEEEVDLLGCFITQKKLSSRITNEAETKLILLNRTYYRHLPKIAKILNISIEGEQAVLQIETEEKSLKKLKQLFDGDDHQELKASL